jgi:hypothetical protein
MAPMRGAAVAVVVLGMAASAAIARANGGPVAEGNIVTRGGITPLERGDIELVEEKAVLKVASSAEVYWVDARYVLRNPAGPKTLLFGVPIQRDAQMVDDPGIKIDVAGRPFPCELRAPTDIKGDLRPLGDPQNSIDTPRSWCVASITVPQGDRVPLRLRYKGETSFEDMEFTAARLGDHRPRELTYDIYPAGYWGGPDASVSIAVDVSALPGVPATPDPKPTATTPERLEWQMRGQDLRRLVRLHVEFDTAAALYQRDMLKINKTIRKPRARASSTLVETGEAHAPQLVADGKGGTAWCAGGTGEGLGEWVELAFQPEVYTEGEKRTACTLDGFGVIPGWARVRSYKVYGRARRIRLSACGGSDPGVDLDLGPLADEPERSALTPFKLELAESLRAQLYECVRLTVLETVPGTEHPQACIGEIIPLFNCESPGEPAAGRKPPF